MMWFRVQVGAVQLIRDVFNDGVVCGSGGKSMAGKRVLSWLQKGWTTFVDPQREERLSRAVSGFHKELTRGKREFNLRLAASKYGVADEEIGEVARRLFARCVNRAWSDDELTEKEQRSLEFIAERLEINQRDAQMIIREEGRRVFADQLTAAFSDGVLEDWEFAILERIAAGCGATPAELFRSEFRSQGEAFIRRLFVKVWEDGRLDQDEWDLIVATVERLGMTDAEFRRVVNAPAQQLVEHFLADFKSDEEITPDEEEFLNWMLTHLISDAAFTDYVRSEVEETKRIASIRQGRLPSIPPPRGVAVRSGEIVHFAADCVFTYYRRRSGELVPERCRGVGVVTDDRFLFVSSEHSLQVIHGKVLGYQPISHGLEIQCAGRAAGSYQFAADADAGSEIWVAAIAKANQTLIAPRDGSRTRHIPRDVRQRVWQQCGGRCVECGATQYLEFDHIIPVARGGGNSENNIQLLCRRCNLAKSDAI